MALGGTLPYPLLPHAGCAVCQPHHLLRREIYGPRVSCISHEKPSCTSARSMVFRRHPQYILLSRVLDVRVLGNCKRCPFECCVQPGPADSLRSCWSSHVRDRNPAARAVPVGYAAHILLTESFFLLQPDTRYAPDFRCVGQYADNCKYHQRIPAVLIHLGGCP